MKSRYKIGTALLKLFCLMTGILLLIICLFLLNVIITDFSGIGLIMTSVIGLIATCSLALGVALFRTVTFDTKTNQISVSYLGLFNRTWTKDKVLGQLTEQYTTPLFGTFQRTNIKTIDGYQINIFEIDISNYSELKDKVIAIYPTDSNLKFNEFLPTVLKTSYVILGLMIMTVLITKFGA